MIRESEIDKALKDLKEKNPIINLVETSEKTFELAHATVKGDKDFHKSLLGKLDDLETGMLLYAEEVEKSMTRITSGFSNSKVSEINADLLLYMKTLEENTFETTLLTKQGYADMIDASANTVRLLERIWNDNQEGWLHVIEMAEVMKSGERRAQLEADRPQKSLPQERKEKKESKPVKGGIIDTVLSMIGMPFKSLGKMLSGSAKKLAGLVMAGATKALGPIVRIFSTLTTKFPVLGKIGKVLGVGGKIFGKFIQPILSLVDFVSGFANASDIIGKAGESLSFFDKAMAGLSNVISGLTFGLIDAKDIYNTLFADGGWTGKVMSAMESLYDMLPKGIKDIVSSTLDFIVSFFKDAFNIVNMPLKSLGIDLGSIIETIVDLIGKGLKGSVMGFAVDKISSLFKGDKNVKDVAKSIPDLPATKIAKITQETKSEIKAKAIASVAPIATENKSKYTPEQRAKIAAALRRIDPSKINATSSVSRLIPTDVANLTSKRDMAIAKKSQQQAPVIINQSSTSAPVTESRPTAMDLDVQYQLTGM